MRRICHLTLGHDALDDRIFFKEAVSLRKVYDRITVLAAGPGGRRTVDGIGIVTVPAGRSTIVTMWRLWRAARRERAGIYHLHEPQLLPLAFLLKIGHRARIIYDIHEHLPEMLADFSSRSGLVLALWTRLILLTERWLVLLSDAVVVTSDLLLQRYGKGRKRVIALLNYPRPELFCQGGRVPPELRQRYQDRRVVLYHGQLSRARDIATLIRAAGRAARQVPRLTLLLLGPVFGRGYREELVRTIEEEEAGPCVELLDPIPHPEVPAFLSLAEVGLVVLPELSVFRISLPIKLLEYMACGLPVIGSRLPVIENIVRPSGCGIVVEPSDPASLAEAIVDLLTDPDEAAGMGARGVQAVRDRYNWNHMERRLLDLYADLMGEPC
jgi:glycosyltransferase involved in cell wall biosynthesis